jgi:hypothetical protein
MNDEIETVSDRRTWLPVAAGAVVMLLVGVAVGMTLTRDRNQTSRRRTVTVLTDNGTVWQPSAPDPGSEGDVERVQSVPSRPAARSGPDGGQGRDSHGIQPLRRGALWRVQHPVPDVRGTDPYWRKAVPPPPGRGRHRRWIANGQRPPAGTPRPGLIMQIAGSRSPSYTPDEAVVQIAQGATSRLVSCPDRAPGLAPGRQRWSPRPPPARPTSRPPT